MYVSIRRYRVKGDTAELARRVEAGLVPILRGNPGFVAYYVVDGGEGHCASISIFENGEAAHDSVVQAAVWVRDHAADFLPDPPQLTHGEALVAVTR